jgi:hypothetical protein
MNSFTQSRGMTPFDNLGGNKLSAKQPIVKLYQNPWPDTVPNLKAILVKIAKKRAQHIRRNFKAGKYKRDSFALAIMSPAARRSVPAEEALLAVLLIGPEGWKYECNAIAKAAEHWETGKPAGYGVFVDLTKSADGDFCWGFSSEVDGTIIGGSGVKPHQDKCEAAHCGASFNYFVEDARLAWMDEHPDWGWFTNANQPDPRYVAMAGMGCEVISSSR